MSDTPVTDARAFKVLSDMQSGTREVVDADVSRDFERDAIAHRQCSSDKNWLRAQRDTAEEKLAEAKLASVQTEELRRSIIEECAKVCDETQRKANDERQTCATGPDCARAIRAMLSPRGK